MQSQTERKSEIDLGCLPRLCSTCAVRSSSLCGALSSDEIVDLNRISRRRSLARGQHHVIEGDDSIYFANVVGGVAKLVRGAQDGRMQIVGLLFPSDFISGSAEMSDDHTEPYSIEAATDLELCLFPRDKFTALLKKHPQLEHRLLQRTLDDLQVARDWMVILGRKNARERVASFLIHVARRMQNHGCHDDLAFDLPLSRTEIADHIGLTIETVSRHISELRKSGTLHMHGTRRVQKLDFDALEQVAGF